MKNQKIIAVTGGIGSGKSSVLEILKGLGYPVFSCDEILNEVYSSRTVKKQLKKLFPSAIKGIFCLKIDRKALSKLVFSSPENRRKLESITHPEILRLAKEKIKKVGAFLSFLEVPLLFEGDYQDGFEGVIVVKRNIDDRINSVKSRSNLSREQVLSRISAQVDYDLLDLSKYIVIQNDGDLNSLKEKTLQAIETFL